MEEKRLFLLDAYALIYRAYYALLRAPRVTSKGFNTSAIFGFCNTLDEVLRKEAPSHIAVCFDPKGGHTFRHELYPEYKAQRDKQPEDITAAIPYIKEILAAYNIPAIEIEGFEADDVIGTLARHAEAEGFTSYMMTPDKDYGQLVTDHTFMYRPALKGQGFEVRGPQQVCQRYGISNPHQVIDLLALEGDASDNVPGCPGVGEKTAAKLIAQWGSVDNLLQNVESLTGALKTKVADNARQILFSKELVTIKTDVPLPEGMTIESLRRKPIDQDRLRGVYTELEFRTFLSRLQPSSDTPAAPSSQPQPQEQSGPMRSLFDEPADAPALNIASHTYNRLTEPSQISNLAATLADSNPLAIATLIEGNAHPMSAPIIGIAIATEKGEASFIKLPADEQLRAQFVDSLRALLSDGAHTIVSHDIKRDTIALRRLGISLGANIFDTSVAHYILEPEMNHSSRMLAGRFLGIDATESTAELMACEEADIALQLMPVLLQKIEEQNQRALLYDIEFPLIPVLADMEYNGVRIDTADLATLSHDYTSRLEAMEAEAYQLAGEKFNVASPMQVGEILFGRLAIDPKAKRTKSGAYSTTEEILNKHRDAHPLVNLILEIRGLRKLLSTYINALPSLINPLTGRIHTSYNQTVTATGRISSTNPNLQNIPIRTDDGREIRRAFVPSPGNLMMSADYSQIELRLMAHMSQDAEMIDAFRHNLDIHRATAAKIYHEELDRVTDEQRRHAKTANFGIIYGISAFGLSERLRIPRKEAAALIEGYFQSYPGVRNYIDNSIAEARDKGYVTTIMGRKRMLSDINSRNAVVRGYAERNAVNAPLQGSAADIIKIAMIRIARRLKAEQLQSKMIMQVHDELVFDVVPAELDRLKAIVVSEMEGAFNARIPLEVSVGTGANWLEAH